MTSHVDNILARARLSPSPSTDTAAAAAEARIAARLAGHDTPPPSGPAGTGGTAPGPDEQMARDLRTLCEAITARHLFASRRSPPPGPRAVTRRATPSLPASPREGRRLRELLISLQAVVCEATAGSRESATGLIRVTQ